MGVVEDGNFEGLGFLRGEFLNFGGYRSFVRASRVIMGVVGVGEFLLEGEPRMTFGGSDGGLLMERVRERGEVLVRVRIGESLCRFAVETDLDSELERGREGGREGREGGREVRNRGKKRRREGEREGAIGREGR